MTPPTTGPDLPAPRGATYRISLVCMGNICRSPVADVVLTELVDRAGLADFVEVSSCGTGGWHVGQPMDDRAAATLRAADYDPSGHRGRQLDESWFDRDLLLAMDGDNLHDVLRMAPPGPGAPVIRLFRDFDPIGPGDVPDPYYGGPGGFDDVLAMVERTATVIVARLEALLS